MRPSMNSWRNVEYINADCKKEKNIIQSESHGSSKGYFNNLLVSESKPTTKLKAIENKIAPSSSKSRLRKDIFGAYKDPEESPKKPLYSKSKSRKVTKEDEEEMHHLVNITKEAKEYQPAEPDVFQKPMRKIKTNKIQKLENVHMKPRSPAKVAMRLRIPLCDRNYSFRSRDSFRTKDAF